MTDYAIYTCPKPVAVVDCADRIVAIVLVPRGAWGSATMAKRLVVEAGLSDGEGLRVKRARRSDVMGHVVSSRRT